MGPHVEINGLEIRYGSRVAVSGLTISMAKGELVSLLGPSGCGKTTTLRALAGFAQPSAGQIRVAGKDITHIAAHRRNIGVVFQSYALFPHLTAIDNVAFGLRMRGVAQKPRRERAAATLAMVGLADFADRYPAQLSGGQQQRVALARALVIEPSILLLDEPLSNLDAHLRADMRAEIRALQQRLAITTVFVTHDQEEALAISDRVCVMQDGRLIAADTPRALCDNPHDASVAAFLGGRSILEGQTENGVFRAPGLVCRDAPAGAQRIVLRAARLALDGDGGPLDLTGEVRSLTYLGDAFEVDLKTPAGAVRVHFDSTLEPPVPGRMCRITARPGGVAFTT